MTNEPLPHHEYVEAIKRAPLWEIIPWLTTMCPECNRTPKAGDTDHIFVGPFIAVACEGFWVINPNVVGLDRPDWMDWIIEAGLLPDED